MFNLFIIAALFGLIVWLAGGFRGGRRDDEGGRDARELVRDALTGVYFPKDEAVTIVRGGETFYFLNHENRDQFLAQR